MQRAESKIRTRISVPIPYDDNHNTKSASTEEMYLSPSWLDNTGA